MPKAGWYQSPESAVDLQWWDGKSWSQAFWPHTQPRHPYLPGARRWDISAAGEPSLDLVGENWRESAVVEAIGGMPQRDVERERYLTGELVLEPDNPHDRMAVSLRINDRVVGYLPSELAVFYAPVLAEIVRANVVPTVRTRIWAVTRFSRQRSRDELKSAIRVALLSPDNVTPVNTPPNEPHAIIPAGRSIQVTGEESHLAELQRYPSGSALLVTLHRIEVVKPRTTSQVIEVRLDGIRVGQLTPATSESIFPLLDEAEGRGRLLAAWATLQSSHLAAELTLKVVKAEAVPTEWPSESDQIPSLTPVQEVPPAFRQEAELAPPPKSPGLGTALWVAWMVAALFLLIVPYVGVLLWLLAIAGAIVAHVVGKRRAPRTANPIPSVA